MSGPTSNIPKSEPRRRLPLWRKVLFSLVPLFALVLVLEVALRILGLGNPRTPPPSSAQFEKVEVAAPDGRVSTYKKGIYIGAPILINERGFREWLYHDTVDDGRIRVAALGDSYTFGDGLPIEETWLRRLGRFLTDAAPEGQEIRTLNFGRRGANTAEELVTLENRILPHRPDLVILGFTVFNDAETAKYRERTTKKYAAREKGFTWKAARFLHDHSHLVNHVSRLLRRSSNRAAMRTHMEKQYADDADGFLECRKSLARIAEVSRREELPLIVLIFPSHHRDPNLNDWTDYEFRAAHDKIKAALAGHPEVVIVDMAEHLEDLQGEVIWIVGNGHPNAVYAARVAEVLAPHARRLLGLRDD